METTKTAAEKLAERKARLLELHKKRQEARTDNHQEVVAEEEYVEYVLAASHNKLTRVIHSHARKLNRIRRGESSEVTISEMKEAY